MNVLDMIPAKKRGVIIPGRKIRVGRDEYREFTQKVEELAENGHELPNLVEHEKDADMFVIELLGEPDLEELDKIAEG